MREVRLGASIRLNPAQQEQACKEAARRQLENRRAKARNRRVSGVSDEKTHLEGVAGEIAFCILFGCEPAIGRNDWAAFDTILEGIPIDIKTTKWFTGELAVHLDKKDKPGPLAYALMTGAFPGPFYCRGFMARAELIRDGRIGYTGGKYKPGLRKCYRAVQQELSATLTDAFRREPARPCRG